MIFLFFKPSLALLEAELAPFKDWEEIGDDDDNLERAEMLVCPQVVMLKVSGFRFLSSAMSLRNNRHRHHHYYNHHRHHHYYQ